MGVRVRVLLLESRGDGLQIGLGLRDRNTRLQPRDGFEAVTAAVLGLGLRAVRVRRVLGDRHVEINRIILDGKLKASLHDTNHGVLASIQHDGVPEDIRVAAEMLLPEIMADDDFETTGSAAALFIIACETAAHLWLDSEHVQKLRAYFYAAQTGRSLLAGERKGAIAIDRAARERAVLISEVEEIRIRQRVQLRLRSLLARIGHADSDELVRRGKWQRLWGDRGDHAEDGGVRANAEGQRE